MLLTFQYQDIWKSETALRNTFSANLGLDNISSADLHLYLSIWSHKSLNFF